MKANFKVLPVLVGAAIALVAASQSVNPSLQGTSEKVKTPCYSEEEVQMLMDATHWTRQAAEKILQQSCLEDFQTQ